MYRFFNRSILSQESVIMPEYVRLKERYSVAVNRVREYYLSNTRNINSKNTIIKLLNSLPVLDASDEYYYRYIEANADKIATRIKASTLTNLGAMYERDIFSDRTIYAAVNTDSNWLTETGFRDTTAVFFMSHESRSLLVRLPETDRGINEPGLSVIGIDIPVLAVQYKRWMIANSRKESMLQESTHDFVVKYVLANMIPSMIDIAYTNRVGDAMMGIESISVSHAIPIAIPDYTSDVDKAIAKVIKRLGKRRRLSLTAIMNGIPALIDHNYLTVTPQYLRDRNTYTYWVTLLTYINFLYPIVLGMDNMSPDVDRVSSIAKRVQRYVVGNKVMEYIPTSDRFDTIVKYNEIMDKLL